MKIIIELSTGCKYRCEFYENCPSCMSLIQKMDIGIFKAIIDDIREYVLNNTINDIRLYNSGSTVDFIKEYFENIYSLPVAFLNKTMLSFWEGELDDDLEELLWELKRKANNITIWLRVSGETGLQKSEELFRKLYVLTSKNKNEFIKLCKKSNFNKINIKSHEIANISRGETSLNLKKDIALKVIDKCGLEIIRDCDISLLPQAVPDSVEHVGLMYNVYGDLYWCPNKKAKNSIHHIIDNIEAERKEHVNICENYCDEHRFKAQYSDYYVFICEKR